MNKPLFITACVLAFITVLIYSFVASAIYKKTTCQNSPYYFCDTAWTCCNTENNCLASKSNVGATLGIKDTALGSYAITDVFYGGKNPDGTTNDYQKYCIDPVNAIVAQNPGVAFNLGCLYDGVIENCSPQSVKDYITTNDLLGACNYTKFDQDGYYPSTGTGDGTWKSQAQGYSSAYPAAYNNLNGTNTKPYSCYNSLYGGSGYGQCS
jgi:hypothetical protein